MKNDINFKNHAGKWQTAVNDVHMGFKLKNGEEPVQIVRPSLFTRLLNWFKMRKTINFRKKEEYENDR